MTNPTYTMNLSGTEAAGVALGWGGGESVLFDAFVAACEAIGVKPPAPLSPASSLERAMAKLVGRWRLSRPYSEGHDGQRKRGRRALVDETVSGRDLTYTVKLRAEVSRGGDLSIFDASDTLVTDPAHPQYVQAEEIRTQVEWFRGHLEATDIKTWLVGTVQTLDGVSILREDRGGVYYIPPRNVGKLREIRSLVESLAGIKCRFLPCVANDADTVETILGGVAQEVADAVAEAALQCHEGSQQRTFAKHTASLAALREKLTRYETLCSTSADDLRAKLTTVEQHVALAALGEIGASFPTDLFGGGK